MNLTTDPLSLPRDRAARTLDRLARDLAAGRFQSEEDLLRAVDAAWQEALDAGGGPTLTPPLMRAGELPLREMLDVPFGQAADDVALAFGQWAALRGRLRDAFNRQRATVLGIEAQLGQVQQAARRFQLFAGDADPAFLWASDSFTSLDHVQPEDTDAYVDTRSGQASLAVTGVAPLAAALATLTIDPGASQGLPGNNLAIARRDGPGVPGPNGPGVPGPDAENPEPEPTLEGVPDAHASVVALFDGSPTTWFEWESCYIPRRQNLARQGTAYVADPAGASRDVQAVTGPEGYGWRRYVQWPGDADWSRGPDGKGYPLADFDARRTARLVLTLAFAEPAPCSTVEILPMTLGGTYPWLRSLAVTRDGRVWEEVARDVYLGAKLNETLAGGRIGLPEGNYTGTGVWQLPTGQILQVRLVLEADAWYRPARGFGHHYYFKVTREQSRRNYVLWTSVDTWTQETRLPNPEEGLQTLPAPGGGGPNVKGLATVAGAAAGTLLGAAIASAVTGTSLAALGAVAGPLGIVAGALLGGALASVGSYAHTSADLRHGDAYDIFDGERSALGLKEIGLYRREYAAHSQVVSRAWDFARPIDALALLATEEIPGDWDHAQSWIDYEVSTDGQTWRPLVPQGRARASASEADPPDVVSLGGARQVFVRIHLRRPDDRPDQTPLVKSYALKGLAAA